MAGLLLGCGTAQQEPADLLPADPDAVVIEMRWASGYAPPRADEPLLVVRADGRVRVTTPLQPAESTDGRIEVARLRALVRELVTERHLLDYDAAAVGAAMTAIDRRTGQNHGIEDAATLRLVIAAGGRSKTIEVEAPDHFAEQYPSVRPLQDVVAAERALTRLYGEITVGGSAEVERLLRAANAELKRRRPDRPQLTVADFADADRRRGGIVATFSRDETTGDGGRTRLVLRVTTDGTGATAAEVQVTPLPAVDATRGR